MIKVPSLSFCITCKNRLHQLKYTLPKNIEDNRLFAPLIEFVLVDFGSTDGLREWIENHFMEEIRSGYLRYLYTDKLPYWHASVAKNTAHWYAKNEILVNLDCDNYTGLFGGRVVIHQFMKANQQIVLHQYNGDPYDGTYGRIALSKELFHIIGGYDESFEPMGYQDADLINRLRASGVIILSKRNPSYCWAIRNTKEEGIKYTSSSLKYMEMLNRNQSLSKTNIGLRHLVSNNGLFGIREGVFPILNS